MKEKAIFYRKVKKDGKDILEPIPENEVGAYLAEFAKKIDEEPPNHIFETLRSAKNFGESNAHR